MGATSELRGALGLQGAWRLLKVLQHRAEGGAQPSTSLPLTGRPGRARHPGRRRCPWLSAQGAAARRGGAGPAGAGTLPGIIRGSQGTSAMSSQLGLAPGRRQQALPAPLVQPSTLQLLWFPHPPPGAQLLWPCFWPCMKVSCPPSFAAAPGSIHWHLLQGYGASQNQLGA